MKRDIRLARYDVRTGWLPQICPRHGAPATGSRKQRFTTPTPLWVWLFLVTGFLIPLVIAAVLAKTERAHIPTCRPCDTDRMRIRLVRVALGLGGLGLLTGGVVASSAALVLLSCLFVLLWVMSLTTVLEPLYAVRGRVVDDYWLDLRDVHPTFVAAIRPNPAWAMAQPAYGYVQRPANWL